MEPLCLKRAEPWPVLVFFDLSVKKPMAFEMRVRTDALEAAKTAEERGA